MTVWLVVSPLLLAGVAFGELFRAPGASPVPLAVRGCVRVAAAAGMLAWAARPSAPAVSTERLALRATVATMVASVAITLGGLRADYADDALLNANLILLIGLAMLVPLPLRLGVPALAAVAAVPPVALLAAGLAHPGDATLAVLVSTLAGGFGQAAMLLLLHTALVDGRARALEGLARLAEHDALTGVFNRRVFVERLAAEVQRAHRYGRPVAVAMFDLDAFKRFNAEFGYAVGDAVLRATGAALLEVTRAPDSYRFGCTVARYGGEEFVALIPDADEAAALALVERCRASVARARVDAGFDSIGVTVSAGLAWAPAGCSVAAGALVEAADRALYASKTAGRDRVTATTLGGGEPDAPQPREVSGRARWSESAAFATRLAALDSTRIHGAVLRWVCGVMALWTTLYGLLDVALAASPGTTALPLSVVLPARLAFAAMLALIAWRGPRWPGWREHLTAVHLVISSAMVGGVLLMMSLTGGPSSPYFPQLIFVVAGWSLALSAPPSVSVGALAALVCAFHATQTELGGISGLDADLLTRSSVLGAAGIAALVIQSVFGGLRAEEVGARARLEELIRVDPLTGLPNRVALEQQLDSFVARARESSPLGVVIVDLDHFKRLNDTHGHLAGDDALAAAASAIAATARTADVVARLGGEEFVVAAPMTGVDGARQLAERVRAAIADLKVVDGTVGLRASCGVATWRDGDSAAAMLARADSALRIAKRSGRDRVVVDVDVADNELLRHDSGATVVVPSAAGSA
ncbi:MAG: GGDEF domain-containing protein [Myxococcales bacterium]|nr:GGDEF domain-containing protein [Myxococcales bacterium]MCB9530224.1 GGDEF domain-containing protein [Myxococcales bacterium]MCB9533737.1 GGDEF domain-containing protein [Myxococcales bacterium]